MLKQLTNVFFYKLNNFLDYGKTVRRGKLFNFTTQSGLVTAILSAMHYWNSEGNLSFNL